MYKCTLWSVCVWLIAGLQPHLVPVRPVRLWGRVLRLHTCGAEQSRPTGWTSHHHTLRERAAVMATFKCLFEVFRPSCPSLEYVVCNVVCLTVIWMFVMCVQESSLVINCFLNFLFLLKMTGEAQPHLPPLTARHFSRRPLLGSRCVSLSDRWCLWQRGEEAVKQKKRICTCICTLYFVLWQSTAVLYTRAATRFTIQPSVLTPVETVGFITLSNLWSVLSLTRNNDEVWSHHSRKPLIF